jgi:D-amino-acid dehydrogenase
MVNNVDVIVFGAGIVGASVAFHLQLKGREVALVDRQRPGEGTSFGNAGIIQSEAFVPHLFPRQLPALLRYAQNRSVDASYHPAALLELAGPFFRYWQQSRADRAFEIARKRAPLISRCVTDHLGLAEKADALDLLRPTGWTQVYSDSRQFYRDVRDLDRLRSEFGIDSEVLDSRQLALHEPELSQDFIGAVHWTASYTVSDPHALTSAYARQIEKQGGLIRIGDAASLEQAPNGWTVRSTQGLISAKEVVICLGPWSPSITKRFGYSSPLFVKRGYHMNFSSKGDVKLNRPVQDVGGGYVLAPMRSGTRLLTGVEFARLDAPPTPVQLARAEPAARRAFPALDRPLDPKPWMGSRPCTPDMLPIIGPAGRAKGMWYAFGHGHQGLTLGPTTGALLASMMTGEAPFTDPTPYHPDRF